MFLLLISLYDVNIFEKIRYNKMIIYIRIYHHTQFLHVHTSSNDLLHRLISK